MVYDIIRHVCRDPQHNDSATGETRCRLTRHMPSDGASSSSTDPCPAAGRCLGLMTTWLLEAEHFDTADEHTHPTVVKSFTHAEKELNRVWLSTIPNGSKLMTYEREQRPGEGPEPLGDP